MTISFNGRPAKLYTLSDITERVNVHQEKERLESELEKAKKMVEDLIEHAAGET